MSAPTGSTPFLPTYALWLTRIFIALCVVGGVYEAAFGPSDSYPIVAAGILFAGALLVAAGLVAMGRNSRWLAVALVTLGSLPVGVIFFWTIVASIAAVAIIVFFVMSARRASAPVTP